MRSRHTGRLLTQPIAVFLTKSYVAIPIDKSVGNSFFTERSYFALLLAPGISTHRAAATFRAPSTCDWWRLSALR